MVLMKTNVSLNREEKNKCSSSTRMKRNTFFTWVFARGEFFVFSAFVFVSFKNETHIIGINSFVLYQLVGFPLIKNLRLNNACSHLDTLQLKFIWVMNAHVKMNSIQWTILFVWNKAIICRHIVYWDQICIEIICRTWFICILNTILICHETIKTEKESHKNKTFSIF